MTNTTEQPKVRHSRRTPINAHGEAAVWATGAALLLCLLMVTGTIAVIVWRGGATFWPGPIDDVTLASGERFLGVPLETEPIPGTADSTGASDARRRYRVGNRDLGQESFRWVPLAEIADVSRPEEAWLVERQDWGVFLGVPEQILELTTIPPGQAGPDLGDGAAPEILRTDTDGSAIVRDRRVLADGTQESVQRFGSLHADAATRRAQIQRLNDSVAPSLQTRLTNLEWRRRAARLARDRGPTTGLIGTVAWIALGAGFVCAGAGAWWFGRRARATGYGARRRVLASLACLLWVATLGCGLALVLERPWGRAQMTDAQLALVESGLDQRRAQILGELEETLATIAELRREDDRVRIVIREPTTGRFAPRSRSEPDEPMRLSQIVRVVPANSIGLPGRARVYLARWWEFLSDEPRANGAEGGVFPVIVGTVTLTLLLTVSVVPLGVIAAIYMREYARQGLMTSAIRVAINNLAGVPSIVYGMFGLGFFCYLMGGFLDGGPTAPAPRGRWWLGVVGVGAAVTLALTVSMFTVARPGKRPPRLAGLAKLGAGGLWAVAAALSIWLTLSTPYFQGFFGEKLPETPTFGGRGILWASLTLALLTLPVVIVATEEAIAAVPNSMREGSLACGASRWQTIRQVVLPSSFPGILTGAILAMARGAGEVAPLMLVGAVNFAPSLPVSGDFPFLHGDRTFMHLGFHIYSLGFQSPDSEATEPLVWTTTLLLISIVIMLNLAAIFLRARLRARAGGGGV